MKDDKDFSFAFDKDNELDIVIQKKEQKSALKAVPNTASDGKSHQNTGGRFSAFKIEDDDLDKPLNFSRDNKEEPHSAALYKTVPDIHEKIQEEEDNEDEEENLTLAALVARRIAHGKPRKQASGQTDAQAGKRKKLTAGLVIKRTLVCLGTAVAALLVFLIGVLLIVNRGPSVTFRDMFVMTVSESSAGDFLATWFLPEDTIRQILEENAIKTDNKVSTGDDVVIATPAPDQKPFEIVDVSGKTFTGKMIIVADPSRVKIGTPPGGYGEDKEGMSTLNMASYYNSLAAVNGGGFYDTGKGNGGVPTGRENSDGIVISGGKMLWGNRDTTYEVIGINKENKLVLGKMTGGQALDSGIVEALNFGPYLIIDGEPCVIGSAITEGGLNPRTAIGQRKDGAMLLLVINGRQANSLGASYDDLISVMLEYGAVNAANLDGGSSSYMVYENEIITTCASLYGPRKMATSILVTK